ncbi:hypothetical protein LguiB_016914 [Lonicera macranthoides]
MKGANYSRLWGQFSFTLVTIIFTTIFLWSLEKNPLISTLLSAHDQFITSSSDIFVDEPSEISVSLDTKEHFVEEHLHSQLADVTREGDTRQRFDTAISARFSQGNENKHNLTPTFKSTACNYAKGRWVADRRRPLYSGFKCKQWLSDMWACRLTKRSDFSYEGYRWQPENCEMPEFDGSQFLRRMQDKTIAFVGDSLGRQQFQSLMCMVTTGEERPDVENIGWKYGLIKPQGVARPDGWAYRFPKTNTTILYYWSSSLCDIQPINITNPNTQYAMHLDQPPSFLSRFIGRFDVLILNTGHHWNRGKLNANRWVMHVQGKPVEDRKLAQMGNAKNFTVYSVVKWVDSRLHLYPRLKVFFRTLSPRHFFHGDWDTGGRCDSTTPLARGSEVMQDESGDPVVEAAVRGTDVRILDITAISELREEGHISRYTIKSSDGIQDCLHWCLPGIPDTWNEILHAQI